MQLKQKVVEQLLLKNLKIFLKERCALLGFVPNDIPENTFEFPEKQQSYIIKIAGDFTFVSDTAQWRELNVQSSPRSLDLSKEELSLVVFRFLKEIHGVGELQDLKPNGQLIDVLDDVQTLDLSVGELSSKLLEI